MIENKRIKIGIISDTHGLLRTEVLDILQSCDCIFHAGDVDRPELLDTIRSLGALYVVRGNNDGYWAQNLRRSLNFTVGNVKFFMVHDRKDVAWELGDTQVVIFGHSHQYFAKEIDGRLWLNPGSCGAWRAAVRDFPGTAGHADDGFLAKSPAAWRRARYDRGKRQLAGGKNRALNSCNVEKRNIQNTVLQLCCRKIGKNRGENCRKMTLQF